MLPLVARGDEADPTLYGGPNFHSHISMEALEPSIEVDSNEINLCDNSINYGLHRGNYRLFNHSIFHTDNMR